MSGRRALVAASVALAALAPGAAARAEDVPDAGHRRVLDVELHPLLSIPDALGLCVEGHPMQRGLSVRGCASIQIFVAAALSLDVSYRFPIHEGPTLWLGLGPAAGSHAIFDTPRGPLIDVSADGFASFEAVWWRDRSGFQLQLGAGASYMAWDAPSGITARWVPIVDVTLGFAFRTKGVGTPASPGYFGR